MSEYRKAGVDLCQVANLAGRIGDIVKETHTPGVISGVGGFCSIFDAGAVDPDYNRNNGPLIAQSVDGVGTKVQIARMMSPSRLRTCGVDIVNHCINDILTCGAKPATFLDYIAQDKLRPDEVLQILEGMARACKDAGIALVGGETAQMQGTYEKGESDIVGFITGFVARDDIIDGNVIWAGDRLIGLASNGLHTNGYSLVRKIFAKQAWPGKELYWPYFYYKEIRTQLCNALLRPHLSYLEPINTLREKNRQTKRRLVDIQGIAHITGGGIAGNLIRILPEGIEARVDKSSWVAPSIFQLIQKIGEISEEEMFRVFNMGIGMILVVPSAQANFAMYCLEKSGCKAYEIGYVQRGDGGVVIE